VAAPGTIELAVQGETALLAPPGDADALRGCLETLAKDAALRRKLGAAGRERALTEFSEERSTDRWLELLWKATQDA
jgi:glycosyltransferase involved in cell wall biosynthesis